MMRAFFVLVLLAAASPASAQRTFRIDSFGGGDFRTLAEAFASPLVGHGDILLVHSSVVGATTDKGVRVVADIGNYGAEGVLRIENLPAGQTFALVGAFGWLLDAFRIELADCAGHVLIDGCRQDNSGSFTTKLPYTSIDNCAHVSINDSYLYDVRVQNGSFVRITRSSVIGTNSPPPNGHIGTPGLTIRDSDVELSWCEVRGASTANVTQTSNGPHVGIDMRGGRLRIAGTHDLRRSMVACGPVFYSQRPPVPTWAIRSDGGEVDVDPEVPLNPGIPHDPTTGTSSFKTRPLPFVLCRRVLPGASLAPQVYAPPGSAVGLCASLPVTRPTNTPFGALWLDGPAAICVGGGIVPQGGAWTTAVPVPASTSLGTPLVFQAAVFDGRRFALSLPSELVIAFFQCCPP
jgi:hypothetical protein